LFGGGVALTDPTTSYPQYLQALSSVDFLVLLCMIAIVLLLTVYGVAHGAFTKAAHAS
jgi:hypothetical protein